MFTVLRSGGDYGPEHVERLARQVHRFLPDAEFACLSDVDVPGHIALCHDWPGWWAKMELFRPDLAGDFLFMDLDSVIVGDLSDMAGFGHLAIMRDVYRPAGLQSSVMFLPKQARAIIWRQWIGDPKRWMGRFRQGGDQAFLEVCEGLDWARWQDVLPGQVVSYKVDVRKRGIPDEARFIAFHGRPRPWEAGW